MMYEVPVGFHFAVVFGGTIPSPEICFQEVSGISAELVVEELREGGRNDFAHRLPNGAKYGNLVLKRGFFSSSLIAEWCRDAIENFIFEPKDILVTLLNEYHLPLAGWTFQRAWPVKWSVSDFKAQENALVIESLELAYQSFRKVGVP